MESEDSVQAFLEFYENIPDYADLNHLSDREFYVKLQQLKTKQKHYLKDLNVSGNESLECNSVKNKEILHKGIGKYSKTPLLHSKYDQQNLDICGRKCYLNDKSVYATSGYPLLKKGLSSNENRSFGDRLERESISYSPIALEDSSKSGKSSCLKCSAGTTNLIPYIEDQENKVKVINNNDIKNNSVYPKIHNKSNKSMGKKLIKNRDIPSASAHIMGDSCSSVIDSTWDSLGIEDYIPKVELCSGSDSGQDEILDLCSYSVPNSPALKHSKTVGWRGPKLTVPKPFRMTLREEEEKHLNVLRCQLLNESLMDEPKEKCKQVKANPVPLESRVPLFDKIMAEQENRRRRVRQQCINQLKSQMKLFKFVKRDEDRARWRLCYSSPDLRTNVSSPKPKSFRARPVPKNLFSAETYQRLYEDEFYRALKKKVRAEEMLRSSSLPPSMAAREKIYKIKAMSAEALNCASDKKKRKKFRTPNYGKNHTMKMRELEENSNGNGSTPESIKLKTTEQHKFKSARFLSPDNSSISSRYEMYLSPSPSDTIYTRSPSALGIPRNRNNLASVLRMQTARQRIEKELAAKQEEMRRKEQAKRKARVTRCKPAWQALNYSTEEDLEVRVQTRREEERIRREEYDRYMELMYGRVQRIPTLFERQSQICQNLREKSLKKCRGRIGPNIRIASIPTTPDLYEEEEVAEEAERSDISEDKESKVGLKVSISETPETIECSSEYGYTDQRSAKVSKEVQERRASEEKPTDTEEPKEGKCIEEKEKDENESLESIEEEISRKSNDTETAVEG